MTLATGLNHFARKLVSTARDGLPDSSDPDAVMAAQAVLHTANDAWPRDHAAAVLLAITSLLVPVRAPGVAGLVDAMRDVFERTSETIGAVGELHDEA